MKEYLDLIIEEKDRKQYWFDNFIAAIEELPIPKEINLTLYQGNEFINMYNTLFDKNYEWWLKELLPISIEGTPDKASLFSQWYIGVTAPDDT